MSSSIGRLPPPYPNFAQVMAKFSVEIQRLQAEKEREAGGTPNSNNDVGVDAADSAAAQSNHGNGHKIDFSA